MTQRHVVVVGAINVDLVIAAPRLPGPGETVVGPGVERYGGGKGANAAVAAARVGASVFLVGAVGADDTGRSALAELHRECVDTSEVAVLADTSTGVAFVIVDPAGENQIAVGAGANAALTAVHIRAALARLLPNAGCVLVSTEIAGEAVRAAVLAAVAAGVPCLLNPAPVTDIVHEVLASGAILTPNRSELHDLFPHGSALETADPRELAAQIHQRSRAAVIVTAGGDGAFLVRADASTLHVPAPQVIVRDTTGAGDTFNGTLGARLAAGDLLDAAVLVAVTAASLSVGAVGARSAMPDSAALAAQQALDFTADLESPSWNSALLASPSTATTR